MISRKAGKSFKNLETETYFSYFRMFFFMYFFMKAFLNDPFCCLLLILYLCLLPQGVFSKVVSSSGMSETKMGSVVIQAVTGDITKETTDVIVNSSNESFSLKSGKLQMRTLDTSLLCAPLVRC